MTTIEILRAGVERLKTVGWKQGGGIGAGGECCAVITLDMVQHNCQAALTVVRTTAEAAVLHRWNDEPGRTVEEVIDLFERSIASLESGQ